MKKNTMLGINIFALSLLTVSGVSRVLAVPSGVNDKDAQTTGRVTFQENSDATDPIITPTNPDDGTGNTAALRIDAAPHLDFGTITLGRGTQTTNNQNLKSTLQVTDGRGTLAGWHVMVSRTDFIKANEPIPLGATLVLNPGAAKNSQQVDVVAELGASPSKTVTVTTVAAPIFVADVGTGGGTYYQEYNGDKARLTVDSNTAKVGEYTADLIWTLNTGIPDPQTGGN